ncbi:MAG: hypothetical protein H0V88_12950 [Pyrinomonadaceae bacterium]|nr:hypothetical protein [Pyrinomonadaceae bacterium]
MSKLRFVIAVWVTCAVSSGGATAQQTRARQSRARSNSNASVAESRLNGVYRIDPASSDKLYSVVANASSNVPFGEQQRFFIDLTIRLTPPDQLAIERRRQRISIASSRAPRISFEADGITRTETASEGRTVRTRAVLNDERLAVSVTGGGEDNYAISFDSIDGGRRLRVTRRIYAEQLNQPVVIQSIYNKISDVARWDIYGETPSSTSEQTASAAEQIPPASTNGETGAGARPAKVGGDEAARLRTHLDEWIAATNSRDIRKQMTFYMPTLKAFYLARNVTSDAVRAEKIRAFRQAETIDIQAAAPEIVFLEGGRTALMRFRKRYHLEGRNLNRRGEVVQELRWQQTNAGWKIFSERDVRVIR